jgi:hypothetical protein
MSNNNTTNETNTLCFTTEDVLKAIDLDIYAKQQELKRLWVSQQRSNLQSKSKVAGLINTGHSVKLADELAKLIKERAEWEGK